MAIFFVKARSRLKLRLRSKDKAVKTKRQGFIRRLYLTRSGKAVTARSSSPSELASAKTIQPQPQRNDPEIETEFNADSVDSDASNVVLEAPNPLVHSPLLMTLHDSIHPFLRRRTGGMMPSSAANTAVKRIAYFIEWAYRYLHQDNAPSVEMAASPRHLFTWFMRAISKHPIVLEEYITYQTEIFQRCPSTIINHFDALQQCYNFLVHDGQLADGSRAKVRSQFLNRFPFVVKRCKRTLRTQLKRYKYVMHVY